MARGEDAQAALAAATETPFPVLEERWQAHLRNTLSTQEDAPSILPRRLANTSEDTEEISEITREDARRHTRLGDLLWDHGRPRAAAEEYNRAHQVSPDDPIIASRLARAALTGGQPQQALDALAPFRSRYREHAPTWAISGSAWLHL